MFLQGMLGNIRGVSAFIVSERPLLTRGEEGAIYWGPAVRKGAWDPTVSYIFVIFDSIIICRLHKSILSDKVHVTLPLTVRFFRFQVKIFSRSALAEGPNPLSPTLVNVLVAEINILIMFIFVLCIFYDVRILLPTNAPFINI